MRFQEILEGSDSDFDSLDAIIAWAHSLGVKLDATEYSAPPGSKYSGSISIIWIQRGKRVAPGAGATVMTALCQYADSARAVISLQADDEVGLPAYYARFGFRVEKADSGDDVTPTGPDMIRVPRTRKARRPLGSARPFSATVSQPIGVAVLYMYKGADRPSYFRLFPANEIKPVQNELEFNDAEEIWVGYVIDTIEWTELLGKESTGRVESIPSIHPNPPDEKWVRSNKRWADLFTVGRKVFELRP